MSAKEITTFRKAGRLDEAYQMALKDREALPNDIWVKRAMSWVLYAYLKEYAAQNNIPEFTAKLREISNLSLPEDEKMLYDNVAWQVIKVLFSLLKNATSNYSTILSIFNEVKQYSFTKPSEVYSVLFKVLHKTLKDSYYYIKMADWWGFDNFRPEDYEKEQLQNSPRKIMSIAEQAYLAYAKHLLPHHAQDGTLTFNREKAEDFLPKLDKLIEKHPEYEFPQNSKANLLLALGRKEDMLETFLPFARKKSHNSWIWETLADAFEGEEDKVIACHCKGLLCKSPETMVVKIRQKMAEYFIANHMFDEAKTEVYRLVKTRGQEGWKIPAKIARWEGQDWYKNAIVKPLNIDFYKAHSNIAEDLLYSNLPTEFVIVDFVNTSKKILNFIASEEKFGFFKYDRFLKRTNIGNTLEIRFGDGKKGGWYNVFTVKEVKNDAVKEKFIRKINGRVRIPQGKHFGFLDDVYIHASLIKRYKISNGDTLNGVAIKSYDKAKDKWTWKLMKVIKRQLS